MQNPIMVANVRILRAVNLSECTAVKFEEGKILKMHALGFCQGAIYGSEYAAIRASHWYGRIHFRIDLLLDLCNALHNYKAIKRKLKVIIEICT